MLRHHIRSRKNQGKPATAHPSPRWQIARKLYPLKGTNPWASSWVGISFSLRLGRAQRLSPIFHRRKTKHSKQQDASWKDSRRSASSSRPSHSPSQRLVPHPQPMSCLLGVRPSLPTKPSRTVPSGISWLQLPAVVGFPPFPSNSNHTN